MSIMKSIKKHKLIIIFTIIVIITILGLMPIWGIPKFLSKIRFINSITIKNVSHSLPIISLAGVIFSYFYNKIMERRIALHSEAQWRPRLYNLMAKKKVTYNDVLYFTAFFNVHNSKDNDVDTAIRIAINHILNKNIVLDTDLLNLYERRNKSICCYKIISVKKLPQVQTSLSSDQLLLSITKQVKKTDNLLSNFKTVKSLNESLEKDQIILFKACISELLKTDWDRQK